MPCSNCNNLRIFKEDGKIICPFCTNLDIVKKSEKLNSLEQDLFRIRKSLKRKLKKIYNYKLNISLIKKREDIAFQIIQDFKKKHILFTDWFTINIILKYICNFEKTGVKSKDSGLEKIEIGNLYEKAKKIYELENLISLLRKDRIFFVKINKDTEMIYKTEKYPITSLPESFYSDEEIAIFEQEFFQESFYFALEDMIKSELFSRYLKNYYNRRILPFLKTRTVKRFYFLLQYIIDNFMLYSIPFYLSEKGLLISKVKLSKFIDFLKEQFHLSEINWFINNMIVRNTAKHSLFDFFWYNQETGVILIPLISLQILQFAVYKRMRSPQIGDEYRIKGAVIEDLVYRQLNVLELELKNPKDNTPLLGVQLPDKKYGDLDIGGFNDRYLILIESKYWDAPILPKLEEEIMKFHERCKYIEKNLHVLGLKKPREIIKIFYTPFAPYFRWNDILLFPSRGQIIFYLQTLIPRKSILLSEPNECINKIVKNLNGYHPFPRDASDFDPDLPKDKYRIQDAKVLAYKENEIVLSIFNDQGLSFPIFCFIKEDIYNKLIIDNIGVGSFIKCIISNLIGFWNEMQLIYFKPVQYNQLLIDLIRLYHSETFIYEIFEVFTKYSFNLQKLISHCQRKNQNIYDAIGKVLVMHDHQNIDNLFQCECGEIVGYSTEHYNRLKQIFPKDWKKCKYCAPDRFQKLQEITGGQFIRISHKFTDFDLKKRIIDRKKK